MFITKDTLIGNNPTSEQLSLSLQLASSTTISKLQFFHLANAHIVEHVTHFLSKNSVIEDIDLRNSSLQMENTINITNLREFNIRSSDITEDPAESIAHFLSQNCKLEELDLGCNKLQAAGAIKIAEMSNITNLRKLNIRSNDITEDAAESISRFLSQNCKLEELDLGCNKLKAAGAIEIVEISNITNLKKLNIRGNDITENAAESIAHFLSQNYKLEELDLGCNKLQSAGAIKITEMSSITNLRKLNIRSNDITENAAESIAHFLSQNCKLVELHLCRIKLQAAGISKIAEMSNITNLRILNISSNYFTDDAAESIACFLSQNCKLEELYLFRNKFRATGAIKIVEMSNITNLKILNISSNYITDDAAESIAHFLSQNCKLEELDLSFNKLQATGAIKIAEMSNITNLRKLNISDNDITDDAAESIACFLSQNCKLKHLDLSNNELQAAGAIKIMELSNAENLNYFDISNNSITDQAAHDKVVICFKGLYPTGVMLVL